MDNRFKFDLPREWQDQTVYYFKGPDIDGTGHQIMLTLDRNLQHEEIGQFARQKTDPIVRNLGGLEVLKDEDVTLENGNPVYEFICKWVPSDELTVIKVFIFVFYGGTGFSFSCDFSRKSHKMLGGQLRKIVESLLPGTYEEIE
ncbi:MAG: DcrB-related protein [Candidatus Krumholzibacteriota bacterium]|nr:DcrB-related protein [Candidatus Krumholzibacteriota bacterium]